MSDKYLLTTKNIIDIMCEINNICECQGCWLKLQSKLLPALEEFRVDKK